MDFLYGHLSKWYGQVCLTASEEFHLHYFVMIQKKIDQSPLDKMAMQNTCAHDRYTANNLTKYERFL